MKTIILAAGIGRRFKGLDLPKPLTRLANGKSILQMQVETLGRYTSLDDVLVVVGYHKEKIIEQFPSLLFVYNPDFAQENTSKSLLRALCKVQDDLLWINGDVVFHPEALEAILDCKKNSMMVNVGPVGEEEVKYRANDQGRILEVSKQVLDPQGEALGINYFKKADLDHLKRNLEKCENNDYFEKAMEFCIAENVEIWSVPVDAAKCTEIDFPEDLDRANQIIF